jgi:tetratricopeptide (TPR) repeat protein
VGPAVRWGLALLASAGLVVGTQLQLAKAPPPVVDVNMLFVPSKVVVGASATGFENLIADGLWLGLLQYYGDRLAVDQAKKTVNLPQMFDLITDLDPQFYFAYWLGTWAIGDSGDADAAVALLKKGARLNPQAFDYPYLQGFAEFLFRRDYRAAAQSFERAARYPDAPRFARTMAARMYQKQGQDTLALQTWQRLYANATDANTRGIAKRNIARIEAEMKHERPRAIRIDTKHP